MGKKSNEKAKVLRDIRKLEEDVKAGRVYTQKQVEEIAKTWINKDSL